MITTPLPWHLQDNSVTPAAKDLCERSVWTFDDCKLALSLIARYDLDQDTIERLALSRNNMSLSRGCVIMIEAQGRVIR